MHNPSNQDQEINDNHYYHVILRFFLSLASCSNNVTFSNKIQYRILQNLYLLYSGTVLQLSLDFYDFDSFGDYKTIRVMFPCA